MEKFLIWGVQNLEMEVEGLDEISLPVHQFLDLEGLLQMEDL